MVNLPAEIALLLVSVTIFLMATTFIIRSSSLLARILGLSAFSISFILMAFATSLPEIFLGLISSSKGLGEMGVGIILGSSIVNLTLITGLIAVFSKKIKTDNKYRKRQALTLVLVSTITILVLFDGMVGTAEALVLIVGYFIYLMELWFSRARAEKIFTDIELSKFLPTGIVLMLSMTTLVIIGDVLINSSRDISVGIFGDMGGTEALVFGAIVLSVITAVPELLFEFQNIRKNKKRIALGDLMGAVGTNSTLAIGLIALVSPIVIPVTLTFQVLLFFFGFSLVLFLIFLYTKEELDWWEGLILVNTYIVFLFLLFLSTLI